MILKIVKRVQKGATLYRAKSFLLTQNAIALISHIFRRAAQIIR